MRKSRGWKVRVKDLKGDEMKENKKYSQIRRQRMCKEVYINLRRGHSFSIGSGLVIHEESIMSLFVVVLNVYFNIYVYTEENIILVCVTLKMYSPY